MNKNLHGADIAAKSMSLSLNVRKHRAQREVVYDINNFREFQSGNPRSFWLALLLASVKLTRTNLQYWTHF